MKKTLLIILVAFIAGSFAYYLYEEHLWWYVDDLIYNESDYGQGGEARACITTTNECFDVVTEVWEDEVEKIIYEGSKIIDIKISSYDKGNKCEVGKKCLVTDEIGREWSITRTPGTEKSLSEDIEDEKVTACLDKECHEVDIFFYQDNYFDDNIEFSDGSIYIKSTEPCITGTSCNAIDSIQRKWVITR